MLRIQAGLLENLARGLHKEPLRTRYNVQVVDLVTLLMHTTFTMVGHAHGLTCKTNQGIGHHPQDMHTDQLLEEAWDRYEQVKAEAEEQPGCAELQVQRVMQWTWLHQARQALKPACSRNPKGLAAAVKSGQQEIQLWLTKALMEKQPTLEVETQEKAAEVNEFRRRVSRLDGSSSVRAEEQACRDVETIKNTI